RVFKGGPILHISHDGDGEWQFLCDADHSVQGACPAKLVCLSEGVKRNPDIVELSDLCANWTASRPRPGAGWVRVDLTEETIRENIRKSGWHACMIDEDEEGPGFVYSIGLFKTWRKPEIIIFGLPAKVAHSMIWTAADLFKEGADVPIGVPVDQF